MVILDQLSKLAIQKFMELGSTIPILQDFFHLTYIKNYGAAFSILQNKTILLTVLPIVMIILIIGFMFYMRKKSHPALMISMSLIVAGGLGNLIDRLAYGYVVDFVDFRVFPIFNVADICVCCGCGLLLIYMFFIEPKISKRSEENEV